jgi:carboxypeptidase family protein/TonB-dependent receptor-like protein
MVRCVRLALVVLLLSSGASAQSTPRLTGHVTDETGGALPGVVVQARPASGAPQETVTSASGDYQLDGLTPGRYQVSFTLINFASARRDVVVENSALRVDAVLHLSLNAEVTVTGRRSFANLADVENPAENLVGIAQSASQGAITAQQLEVRPIMRQGEVLETVPGVIITQHSGEGKANQYFLRGFNLDHGSDFAMTVAGTPVNMPTHAHSQGYSDLNFLIPELVSGVQFSKGPYFADQGDFATAGASNITYATSLDHPLLSVEKGAYGFARAFVAASPRLAGGHLLMAFESSTNDGPWTVPDAYRKVNGVVRYSRGDSVNGFSLTGMGYHGRWNATEAAPERAVNAGTIDRFGSIDATDGGHSHRYSLAGEWQRGTSSVLTKVSAFGLAYDLDLISNFTFFLDDPVHGDQIEQRDHRFVTGVKALQRRVTRWGTRQVQTTIGVQLRNDDIPTIALYHTERRVRLETRSQTSALVTTGGVYAQSDIEWAPWLRTTAGLRGDASRYRVNAMDPANSGTASAGLISPKGGVTIGPWKGTELYVNAGTGFHSNDARGTTITRDRNGDAVDRVTPLVRGTGAEFGVRTVALRHLQSTLSVWRLRLDSELVYNGDLGATEPGPASRRYGVEWTNYYSPVRWLTFDGDVSWSRAYFSGVDSANRYVPEAVGTVVSAGVSADNVRRAFGSLRLRYFGPRPLVDDDAVLSEATSFVNLEAGYHLGKRVRAAFETFNLFNAKVSDIDYYFTSRLPGEPLAGVDDIHSHPAVPRTARLSLQISW